MNLRRSALLIVVAFLAAFLAACGNNNSTLQVTLAFTSGFTPPSSLNSVAPGNTAGIAATITNGAQGSTVSWSVSCSQASCGSFSPTSTASTIPTTYTAPSSVPSGGLTVTITGTYSGGGNVTPLTAMITINAPVISIAFTSGFTPPSSLNTSAPGNTAMIAATVSNDPNNGGVNWTVTCGSAQCGSFSTTPTASGVATTYTAPTSVPTGGTVTIIATAVDSSSATVQATVNINGISIAFTSGFTPPSSLTIGATGNTAMIAATVSNDPQAGGVNWTVTCGSAQCGGFSATHTASGAATTYTAPTTVPTGGTVTITATAADSSTATVSATVTITSNISLMFTAGFVPPNTMNTNTTDQFAVTVTNDPNSGGVNWTVTCGGTGQCGGFNPTSTGSVVPTTYTAPLTVPTGNTVTVTATSVSDYTKTITATITIVSPTAPLPDGTYVYQLSGEDTSGVASSVFSPFNVAGVFTIAGGAITGGEQDFIDYENGSGSDDIHTDSTISFTPDGNIQLVLDTADSVIGVGGNGLETINLTLVTSTSGLLTWFDGFATGTGTLSAQDTTAAQNTPVNEYAFLTSGYDINDFNIAIGGTPDVAGNGSISGNFDVNDDGTVATQVAIANTSNVQGPDTLGRVTFTVDSIGPEVVLVGYIINASTIALVETNDSLEAVTGGIALAQGCSPCTFGNSSISGNAYVIGAQGEDAQPNAFFAGALTFNSGGTVSGNTTLNDLSVQDSGAVTAGNWAIDSTGRVSITGLTAPGVSSVNVELYIDGHGNALAASMDATDVVSGPAYLQTSGASFQSGTNYAVGGFGVSGSTSNDWSAAGVMNITSGSIGANSFTDYNYFLASIPASECGGTAGPACADIPLTGTVSNTSGTIKGLGADSIVADSLTSDTFNFYVISDSLGAFGIETDTTQLGLLYLVPTIATPGAQHRSKPAHARTVTAKPAQKPN